MKIRAMVEVTVTLTADEWQAIEDDYAYNWRDEIRAGDVPAEIGAADAWVGMLSLFDDPPGDFEISWDGTTDEEFADDI